MNLKKNFIKLVVVGTMLMSSVSFAFADSGSLNYTKSNGYEGTCSASISCDGDTCSYSVDCETTVDDIWYAVKATGKGGKTKEEASVSDTNSVSGDLTCSYGDVIEGKLWIRVSENGKDKDLTIYDK